MNLDEHGLPRQSYGDVNDQLQRCGMVVAAACISDTVRLDQVDLYFNCKRAIEKTLQPRPGTYVRHVGGNANNVSADQLIGALCGHVALRNTRHVFWMFIRMVCRLGCAQNYKDGLDGTERVKIPDFMALRASPLFCRGHWFLYPCAMLSDVLLVALALVACGPVWRDDKGFSKRSPDDVDDNNTIVTLAVCRYRMPTPLSYLASRIYGKLRPWNYGCRDSQVYFDDNVYHPVYGALRWYHRAENGGNPEIAEMYREICKRYFE